MARDDVAVGALAFFGKPLDKRGRVVNFSARLDYGLAAFGRHQHGQVFPVGQHQVIECPQPPGALGGAFGGPAGERIGGGINGAAGFGRAHVGNRAQQLSGGRVADLGRGPTVGIAPVLANTSPGAKELLVGQCKKRLTAHFHLQPESVRHRPSLTSRRPHSAVNGQMTGFASARAFINARLLPAGTLLWPHALSSHAAAGRVFPTMYSRPMYLATTYGTRCAWARRRIVDPSSSGRIRSLPITGPERNGPRSSPGRIADSVFFLPGVQWRCPVVRPDSFEPFTRMI